MLPNSNSPTEPESDGRPIISRSSILILSGALIGMATGWWTRPTIEFPVFIAGVVGLAIYIGIGFAMQRRKEQAERARIRTARVLETRMHRHISHAHDPFRQRPHHLRHRNSDQQYVTVVTSGNERRPR